MKKILLLLSLLFCISSAYAQKTTPLFVVKDRVNKSAVITTKKQKNSFYSGSIQLSATVEKDKPVLYCIHLFITESGYYAYPGGEVKFILSDRSSVKIYSNSVAVDEGVCPSRLNIPYNKEQTKRGEGVGEYYTQLETKNILAPDEKYDQMYLSCPVSEEDLDRIMSGVVEAIEIETVQSSVRMPVEANFLLSDSKKNTLKNDLLAKINQVKKELGM